MAVKTKDRILSTSLQLFNEAGYSNVTTARIAEAVGISEGNLWYHFRTKQDLVGAHIQALHRMVEARLATESSPDTVLEAYCAYNRKAFEEISTYHFLFRDQIDYSQGLRGLNIRSPEFYARSVAMLQKMFRDMREAGHLKLPDAEIAPLADNVWIVIRFWAIFLRDTRGITKLDKNARNAGIRHHLALFENHLTSEARAYFDSHAYDM